MPIFPRLAVDRLRVVPPWLCSWSTCGPCGILRESLFGSPMSVLHTKRCGAGCRNSRTINASEFAADRTPHSKHELSGFPGEGSLHSRQNSETP